MEEVVKYLSNPVVFLSLSNVVVFVIGLWLPNKKIKELAAGCSKYLRKTFGKKVENRIEEIVSAFQEGLKSDNIENKKEGE